MVIALASALGTEKWIKLRQTNILSLFPSPEWPEDRTSRHTCTPRAVTAERQPGGSEKAEMSRFGDRPHGDAR